MCNPLSVNVTAFAQIAKITKILHELHKWRAHCTECTRHYPEVSADLEEDNSKYSSLIAPQYNTPRTHLGNILAIRGLLLLLLMEDLYSVHCVTILGPLIWHKHPLMAEAIVPLFQLNDD